MCMASPPYVCYLNEGKTSEVDHLQAFALIQSIVVFFAVSKGFGTSIELVDKARLGTIQQVNALCTLPHRNPPS